MNNQVTHQYVEGTAALQMRPAYPSRPSVRCVQGQHRRGSSSSFVQDSASACSINASAQSERPMLRAYRGQHASYSAASLFVESLGFRQMVSDFTEGSCKGVPLPPMSKACIAALYGGFAVLSVVIAFFA